MLTSQTPSAIMVVISVQVAEERRHIVEGLRIAIGDIDEVIRIIRAAQDTEVAKAGLREGDLIVEVNRHEVDSAKDFKQRVMKHKKDGDLKLLVKRANGGLRVVVLS